MNPIGELNAKLNADLNAELKRYLQAIGDLPNEIPGGHPEEESLIAYARERLGAEAQKKIDLHMQDCVVCATRLQDAQDFFAPAHQPEMVLGDFEVHRQWRELRQKLPFESKTILGRITQTMGSRGMLAIAAGLLLTTSLASFAALSLYRKTQQLEAVIHQNNERMAVRIPPGPTPGNLQEALLENRALQEKLNQTETQLEQLEQPQINTPVSEITVGDTIRSEKDGHDVWTTTLPPSARFFTIELHIVSDSFPVYTIAFLDPGGKPILQETDLKPNERAQEKTPAPRPNQKATLSLSIPRRSLPAGRYVFRVYGTSGGEQVLLESLNWSFQ